MFKVAFSGISLPGILASSENSTWKKLYSTINPCSVGEFLTCIGPNNKMKKPALNKGNKPGIVRI